MHPFHWPYYSVRYPIELNPLFVPLSPMHWLLLLLLLLWIVWYLFSLPLSLWHLYWAKHYSFSIESNFRNIHRNKHMIDSSLSPLFGFGILFLFFFLSFSFCVVVWFHSFSMHLIECWSAVCKVYSLHSALNGSQSFNVNEKRPCQTEKEFNHA